MVCLYSVNWQLCDVELDRSESNDLSAQQLQIAKLSELIVVRAEHYKSMVRHELQEQRWEQ
jgi:hypothetical protein